MRFIDLYYAVKPLIPRGLQIRVRRSVVHRRRLRAADSWPILETAGRKPEGWPGWPDGKRFALVLSHDVDTARGQDRCLRMADLETELGFRSSFNFVPRQYPLRADVREELARRGFEIGVHGLEHDGKLFTSRARFLDKAQKINACLKEWGSVGFRAPAMHHNLDWIRDLDIAYDASTFDTDPFEPQPDNVGTIFPFRVAGRGSRPGFVELPYTLPQDFTLFVLMQEQGIDIWKKKLAWIAEHGGMALVNVHPDYACFEGNPGREEYPAGFYRSFLEHVEKTYSGQYWHALPRDVARFCSVSGAGPVKAPPKRVSLVLYSFYERDARVRRYGEALARRGDDVEAVALNDGHQPQTEVINGVRVHRLQTRTRDERGVWSYLFRMSRFIARASFFLARRHLRQPYDLVHAHNIPDFIVLAAWLPKLMGARLILDIHDLVPEFFASKFGAKKNSAAAKCLRLAERFSVARADHVILANHLWRDKLAERTGCGERLTVLINYVDTSAFSPRQRQANGNRRTMLYPGGLQWHQGLDIAIRAFSLLEHEMPDLEFHIYGEGNEEHSLRAEIEMLHLDGRVKIFPPVPIRRVAELMASSDVGIVAKRAESFGNEAYSTKILEYMTQDLPVVASRTAIDTYYFTDNEVCFFKSGDAADMARAIRDVLTDKGLRERLVHNAREAVAKNTWQANERAYLDLVDKLVAEKR